MATKATAQDLWEQLSERDPPRLSVIVAQKAVTPLIRAISMAKHKSNRKLGPDADNRRLTTIKEDLQGGKVRITFSLAEGVIRTSTRATTYTIEYADDAVDFADENAKGE